MKMVFNQAEIEAGLQLYIQSQGIDIRRKTIDISFTAGRKGAGISADVDISDDGSAPVAVAVNAPYANAGEGLVRPRAVEATVDTPDQVFDQEVQLPPIGKGQLEAEAESDTVEADEDDAEEATAKPRAGSLFG